MVQTTMPITVMRFGTTSRLRTLQWRREDLSAHSQLDEGTGAPRARYSADGRYFAVARYLGYVRVWETATWHEVATLRGFRLGTHGASFSSDGQRLATAGGSIYDTVKLWDTESWQDVLTLSGLGAMGRISISGDGNAIGIRSNTGFLQVWQAPTWQEIDAAEKQPIVADTEVVPNR